MKTKKVASKPKKRTAQKTKKRTASKAKLATKRLIGAQPIFMGTLDVPEGFDPKTASPEEIKKLVSGALKTVYKQGVMECAEDITNVAQQYPVVIALEALEMVLIAAMASLGDVEQKALAAHLAQFHAELRLMNHAEPTARIQ